MKRIALALAAAMAATSASAVEEKNFVLDTAADLAALCSVTADDVANDSARHMCLGFITGVHQVHEAVEANLDKGVYCLSEANNVSRDDAAAAIAAWVNEKPEERGKLEAFDGMLTWAAETFPCN